MEEFHLQKLMIYFMVPVFFISPVVSDSIYLDTSKAIAQFSPVISILDSFNGSRYSVDDLVSLIAKVATRFKRIFIQLDITELLKTGNLSLPGQRRSSFWSAVAAAKYNCQPSTKNKVEVILYLNKYTYNSCDCFELLKKPFEEFADEANKICNGTVTTILVSVIQFCYFPSLMRCTLKEINLIDKNDLLLTRYKWGVVTSFQKYCKQSIRSPNIYWDPAVVLIEYDKDEQISTDLTKCNSYNKSNDKPVEFIKKIQWTDRQTDLIINMSNLVANWETKISELSENSFILVQAFDYSGGWWFLDHDPANTNTSAFIFNEKFQVASEVDSKENPRNFEWLKEKITFNPNSIGILVKRDTWSRYVSNSGFCRVIKYERGYKTEGLYKAISEANPNCDSNIKVIYFSNFKSRTDFDAELKMSNVTFLLDLTDLIIRAYNPTTTNYDNYYIKPMEYSKVLEDLKQFGSEYGYAFYINACEEYNQMDDKSKEFLLELLRDPNSTMNVFIYNEGEFDVRTGATQMFIRKVPLFEACKNLVTRSGNNVSEIGFVMQGYYRADEFHRSPWALQNYVRYIKLINKWANEQSNTVVYIGTLRDGEQDGKPVVGWLTLDNSQIGFTTKQEDALKISEFYYPVPIFPNITRVEVETTVGLNTNQIVIVACVAIAVCVAVILCSTYFIRLYYKKGELSEEEMDMFFGGNDTSDFEADKVPYDLNKYEVHEEAFLFDKDEPLGCGEFGMVFRGTVTTEDGDINVAVKTTNLNTRHKTTLKGLLSEIKVLAYVGKHENIIELLGANTSSLKDGNVYIFLELCQLGSLEKYLRDKVSVEGFGIEDINFDSPNIGRRYLAISELTRISLNKSLSDDLYCWSTQICNGMAYLAEKHVVHADLATRNILLNSNREAKICDFGLSRRMYNYTNYVKTGQEPLPWKWMAPEALRYMKFSEKTDVWSYGVTIWEIYSLGSSPYPGLSWDLNFPQMLERGLRLSEPEYVQRNMYELMRNCWKTDPEQRPRFSTILSLLSETEYYSVIY